MHVAPRPRAGLSFNGEYLERHAVQMLGSYRAYNPALMLFHNSDNLSPFGKGGLNSYGYCLGDPVNHVDPTGHMVLWSWRSLPVRLSAATFVATVAVGVAATVVPKGEAKDVLVKTATGLLALTAVLAALPALKYFMPGPYRSVGRLLNGRSRLVGRRANTTSSGKVETIPMDNPGYGESSPPPTPQPTYSPIGSSPSSPSSLHSPRPISPNPRPLPDLAFRAASIRQNGPERQPTV
ncbi:MAG: RHS repeat-associated core domain-containing protein [Paucimonas sp.]|jgi:RHS repeat-associated protein|nr:RHS repeat-associated core domain-containing protein [Paucimonas sp.]